MVICLLISSCDELRTKQKTTTNSAVTRTTRGPPEILNWRDLMPESELDTLDALNSGTANPSMMAQFLGSSPIDTQIGTFNTVANLNDVFVRIPGYILPLDYVKKGYTREFLLLPYHGACIHRPPPPPNQVVYVRSDEWIAHKGLWDPVWVNGMLFIERVDTDMASTAYAMRAVEVSQYLP